MKTKTPTPAGAKPATPKSRARRAHKRTRPRAHGRRRAERLDPPNTRAQARTLVMKARFLADFALCGNVLRSAVAAGCGRRTVYDWRREDSKFAALYDEAHEDALDRLEEEGRRRAYEGVLEPVVSAGQLVTHVRKYSDTLLITLLKGKRPDTFRDRHEVTGKNGGPLVTVDDLKTMSNEDLKAALLAAAAHLPG